jgi:hypothetical protein
MLRRLDLVVKRGEISESLCFLGFSRVCDGRTDYRRTGQSVID